jgi:hypothetical protein
MVMTDRAMVLKKGSLQPHVALFARFPPEADQSQWVVKQALDTGLHGVIFNRVDRKEQALIASAACGIRSSKGRSTTSRTASAVPPPAMRPGSGASAATSTSGAPTCGRSTPTRSAGDRDDRIRRGVEQRRRDRLDTRGRRDLPGRRQRSHTLARRPPWSAGSRSGVSEDARRLQVSQGGLRDHREGRRAAGSAKDGASSARRNRRSMPGEGCSASSSLDAELGPPAGPAVRSPTSSCAFVPYVVSTRAVPSPTRAACRASTRRRAAMPRSPRSGSSRTRSRGRST